MALVLLGLGDMRFYVPFPGEDTPNFEVLSQDSNYAWISSPRLSRSPALQFTGTGEEVVVIEGRLFPLHFGGLSTLAALRAAGSAGQPQELVRFYPLQDEQGYGGLYLGRYVIKRVRSLDQKIGSHGIANKVDFALELGRYGEDAAQVTGSAI